MRHSSIYHPFIEVWLAFPAITFNSNVEWCNRPDHFRSRVRSSRYEPTASGPHLPKSGGHGPDNTFGSNQERYQAQKSQAALSINGSKRLSVGYRDRQSHFSTPWRKSQSKIIYDRFHESQNETTFQFVAGKNCGLEGMGDGFTSGVEGVAAIYRSDGEI